MKKIYLLLSTIFCVCFLATTQASICEPKTTILNVIICEGECLFFHGQFLTESDAYEAHLMTPMGCDSTIVLNLTVENCETSIVQTTATDEIVVGYYSTTGKKLLQEPNSGVYIILYNNGRTKKIVK